MMRSASATAALKQSKRIAGKWSVGDTILFVTAVSGLMWVQIIWMYVRYG